MGYDPQREFQAQTAAKEKLGVFVETKEEIYFTDESPEFNNAPGNRFVNDAFSHQLRVKRGHPNTTPRYFIEKTVVVVERVEITEDEWLQRTGEKRNPH